MPLEYELTVSEQIRALIEHVSEDEWSSLCHRIGYPSITYRWATEWCAQHRPWRTRSPVAEKNFVERARQEAHLEKQDGSVHS